MIPPDALTGLAPLGLSVGEHTAFASTARCCGGDAIGRAHTRRAQPISAFKNRVSSTHPRFNLSHESTEEHNWHKTALATEQVWQNGSKVATAPATALKALLAHLSSFRYQHILGKDCSYGLRRRQRLMEA